MVHSAASYKPVPKLHKCDAMKEFEFLQDTFRGRVCECPLLNGVQYKGDGYTACEGMYHPSSALLCVEF